MSRFFSFRFAFALACAANAGLLFGCFLLWLQPAPVVSVEPAPHAFLSIPISATAGLALESWNKNARVLTFFRSVSGSPCVVVHGDPAGLVYVRGKAVHPHYLVKLLVNDFGLRSGEHLTIICCFPGAHVAGSYLGVGYSFAGSEVKTVYPTVRGDSLDLEYGE